MSLFGILIQQFFDSCREDFVDTSVFPVQFAGPPVSNVAVFVDQIRAWPHRVAPRLPRLFLVVDNDRIVEAASFRVVGYGLNTSFAGQLGSVNCDVGELLI